MARDPSELSILGKSSVSSQTATHYWKLHVLHKYGGFLLDLNILLQSNLETLRNREFSALAFNDSTKGGCFHMSPLSSDSEVNDTQTRGTILASSPSSPILGSLLLLATSSTEQQFTGQVGCKEQGQKLKLE